MHRILAVDDDPQFLTHIQELLQLKHYQVDAISNALDTLKYVNSREYHCVLLDIKMPGVDGITLLQQIKQAKPYLPIIMISGQSTLRIAVQSIKLGAFDFIEKGADIDRLLITVQNAIAQCNWYKERNLLLSELQTQYQMVGTSSAMKKVFQQIETIAPTNAKVLITGETGTGKELVARAIHLRSHRSTKPFVKVNCAAIPDTLIESTFFGHKRGSFTGALQDKKGKFELAHTGSIFLDEIGELPMMAQAKLLSVLQDGEIEKIGENKSIRVDVRTIAATNKNLEQMIQEGQFREDLFYRINMFRIHLPPLRERVEDIPILVDFYLKKFAEEYNKPITVMSPSALEMLMNHPLPGNIRMLRNIIERAVILSQTSSISPEILALSMDLSHQDNLHYQEDLDLNRFLETQEKNFIRRVLLMCDGDKHKAAELMKIDRTTLWRKIKRFDIQVSDDPE